VEPTRLSFIGALATLACLAPGTAAQEAPADTIGPGSPALTDATLYEGRYVLANYRQVDGVDTRQSTTTQTFQRGRVDGVDAWFISTLHVSPDTTRTEIVIRADDLSLVHQRVKGVLDSTAVSASRDYLTGWVHLHEQEALLLDRTLEHPVFPVEGQIPWLFPLLPFTEGYAATIEYFSPWSAGMVTKTVRVLGTETVEVAGEQFDTWKVDGGRLFGTYVVTYSVDRATRRIVRSVARGSGDGPVFWSELER
jgi:hypothetical protein